MCAQPHTKCAGAPPKPLARQAPGLRPPGRAHVHGPGTRPWRQLRAPRPRVLAAAGLAGAAAWRLDGPEHAESADVEHRAGRRLGAYCDAAPEADDGGQPRWHCAAHPTDAAAVWRRSGFRSHPRDDAGRRPPPPPAGHERTRLRLPRHARRPGQVAAVLLWCRRPGLGAPLGHGLADGHGCCYAAWPAAQRVALDVLQQRPVRRRAATGLQPPLGARGG
mmetsp:Transcript_86320/g.247698  ORF Transcript_86320/g.247698 Transcript_86320/m.247698 type:complete len:220 (-) Transcript_86320:795-1454(-)